MSAKPRPAVKTGRRRPKGYADWRPHKSTRALLEQIEAILEEYREHLPLTVRQIFYRLVGSHEYPKTEQAYERLCEKIVRARRAQMLPFEAIRDDGITTFQYQWFAGVEHFWDSVGAAIKEYRRDRQEGQPVRIEIWCEAAGMAPQLARIADNFSVKVYSSGGFSSLTAVREIVDRAKERDVPTVLLHVGDYDPSGVSIFDALAEDAASFLEEDRILATQTIEAVRVALTQEQVYSYDLPTSPPKASDGRSRSWEGDTCQLEALAPDDLAAIVRVAIYSRLQGWTFDEQVLAEKKDVAELWRGLPRGG